ncbi:MAG TPA: hypothetical protein VIV40_41245 [Kofleriaceae bacterium]
MKRFALILLVAACGDNKTTPKPPDGGGSDVDAMPDAPPMHAGVVNAHAIGHYLTEAGDVTAAFTNLQIIDSVNAIVMPTVQTDGTLKFEPVAPGAYLICDTSFSTRFVCAQATGSDLDLDFYSAGRPNGTLANNTTSIALTTTSASMAASPAEFLDIEVLNANFYGFGVPPATPNTPVVTNINWSGRPLLESGDVIRVTQLTTKNSGAETYVAATKTGSVTGLTMVNGANVATVDLATALPQTSTASFTLKRSEFASLAGSPGPNAGYTGFELDGIAEHPPNQFYPWLFQYAPNTTATTDVTLTMSWGVSWPATTAQTFAATFMYQFDATAPGATSPSRITVYSSAYRPIAELTGNVGPKLSRATAVKVNTLDATVAQSGTTETPTISWTAPSLGTANRYTLFVYRVLKQGTGTVAYVSGQFVVTGTTFKIPPGFVHTGEGFMIGVRAETVPGYNPQTPFATAARYELADTITAVHTP